MIIDFCEGASTTDAPQCIEDERSTSAEDLFESASASDLLQSMSHDVNMYYMTDEELLGISAEQLPQGVSASKSAQIAGVPNTLVGDHLHGAATEAGTDATHATQNMQTASVSQSSANIFRTPRPVTASTTFATTSLANHNAKSSLRLNLRSSKQTQYVINPFVQPVGQQRNLVRNPFAQGICTQSPIRNLATRPTNEAITSQHPQSLVRTPACITLVRQMSRSPNARSTAQSILLLDTSQSAFVPARSVAKAAEVTHTMTQNSNTVTSTTACHAPSITNKIQDATDLKDSSITSVTNTDTLASVASTGAPITSYTINDTRDPFPVIVSQSEYNLTAAEGSYLMSTITSRTPLLLPAAPSPHTSVSRMKSETTSTITSDRASAELPIHPYDTTAQVSTYTSSTTVSDATTRSLTRLIIPITYATPTGLSILTTTTLAENTSTKPRCSFTIRPNQSAYEVTTDASSYPTSSATSHCTAPSSGLFTISTSQSANAVTSMTGSGDFTATKTNKSHIVSYSETASTDGLSCFGTAPTAADVITTTHCSGIAPTQNENGAGVGHTPSMMATDTTTKPRNRLIIPIIQSANTTAASLSYLLTSPTRSSLIISTSQSAHATTTSLSSFKSSTIRANTLNRTCNRFIIPQNATGFSYLTTSTVTTDTNKNRSSFTITTSQTVTMADNILTTVVSQIKNIQTTSTIAPTQSAYAHTTNVTSNTSSTNFSDRVTRSRGAATTTTQIAFAANDNLSSPLTTSDVATTPRCPFPIAPTLTAYAITAGVSSLISSAVASESTTKRNRLIIPVTQNCVSTSLNLETTSELRSNISTSPTQNAYISDEDTTSYSASTVDSDNADFRSRLVIPFTRNVNTTTTACNSATTSAVAADANITKNCQLSVAQSCANTGDSCRNRFIITTPQNACTNIDRTTSTVTTFTITRNRCPFTVAPTQSVFTIPATVSAFSSSELASEIPDKCQDLLTKQATYGGFGTTTTLISLATTTTASTALANSRSVSAAQVEHSTPDSLCSLTDANEHKESAAATLTTGHRYIIKLSPQIPLATTALNTVTAAVTTTPVTTIARSSSNDYQFVEPRPVPKLRTFPGPRTYSVSQRSCIPNAPQRAPVRNITPRAFNKKVISHPAPLQIFADVVCPPKASQNQTTSIVTNTQQSPRYTLSHSAGTSTLVVPQYKNTIFKNLSTIARPERANTRISAPQTTASERIVIRRPVAYFSARRSFPCAQPLSQGTSTTNVVTQNTSTRPVRFTFGEIRSQMSNTDAVSHRTPAPNVAESLKTQTPELPASDLPCTDESISSTQDGQSN